MTMVEGILLPWNPVFNPETIRVHVEAHRVSPIRATWWGRLSRGKSVEYSVRPEDEAAEVLKNDPARRPVFVTDYVRLHALRVDFVTRHRPEDVPAYYAAQAGAQVSFWLRVRDVRAISHDQLATLAFLQTKIRTDKVDSSFGFDPYASKKQLFPRRIFAPSNDEIFDRAGAPASGFYADATDAVDRPVAEEAYRRLAAAWGASTWGSLAPFSCECLAHADALYRDDRYGAARRDDVDPAPVLLQLVRAVERELVTELLLPLDDAARSPRATAHGRELHGVLADTTGHLTLGSLVHILRQRKLAVWVRRHVGDGPAARLFEDREWEIWLSQLVDHRNATFHPRDGATVKYVRAVARALLEPDAGPPVRALETIAGARQQIRAVLDGALSG